MSNCVIIRGPLGVGKTTVAQAIAARFAGHTVSIDRVLADHNLEQSDGEGISLACFLQANDLIIPQVQAWLDAGEMVIVDGNFYHLEAIRHLQRRLDAALIVVTLQAPLSTCVERDAGRQTPHGIAAATAVYRLVARVDYGVVIDTEGQTIAQTVATVADHLSGKSTNWAGDL